LITIISRKGIGGKIYNKKLDKIKKGAILLIYEHDVVP
jgi:hypothetical protein